MVSKITENNNGISKKINKTQDNNNNINIFKLRETTNAGPPRN